MRDQVIVRPATDSDAAVIAALAEELGYAVTPEQAARRIAALGAGSAVFVASISDAPVGWIHVCRTDLIQEAPFAEVGGIVVTARRRGSGVGRTLVAAAEAWAVEHGLPEVRLRSRVAREGAHRFYERLGYAEEKTSLTFHKQLTGRSPRPDSGV